MSTPDFDVQFEQLTGYPPFPWQRELYVTWFSQGKFPDSCNLPTGLGKTSVIAIWLLALANKCAVPRRLVYVVNRRTVVDQTTDEVLRYRDHLPDGIEYLAVSTLRGQLADNREWSADPSCPAVICGTVDMIGSRLLFSGYGLSMKSRPLHAGFLGQDALLVHDEAHLEPAFQELLVAIRREQERCHDFRPLQVMEMTATSHGSAKVFELTDVERTLPAKLPDEPAEPLHHVWLRYGAVKKLTLDSVTDEKKGLVPRVVEHALALANAGATPAVLVFVRTVEAVNEVVVGLKKAKIAESNLQTLTGTMRGLERDALAKEDKVFARFKPSTNVEVQTGAVFLVCTSAGEVGVDISADHLVCDLSTFESMAQRFGRVNRYGQKAAQIIVVHPTTFEEEGLDPYREKTLALLQTLKGDASPKALAALKDGPTDSSAVTNNSSTPTRDARLAGFAPRPTILPVSDILFDAWALTSIEDELPGRPDVGPYLHGLADDLPQTTIAWRSEVDLLSRHPKPETALKAIFGKHGIRPHESLALPSYKVATFLKEVLKAKPELGATRLTLLLSRRVECRTLEELVDDSGILFAEPTLVLPPCFGGLNAKGLLTVPKKGEPPGEASLDIADLDGYEPVPHAPPRKRVVIQRTSDGWRVERLLGCAGLPKEWNYGAASSTQLLLRLQKQSGLKVRLVLTLAEDEEGDAYQALVCLSPAPQKDVPQKQTLKAHVQAVEDDAKRLATALFLEDPDMAAVLQFAAKWHDEGKKAPRWQKYIGHKPDDQEPIGKAAEWRDPKILSGYRHEFGSLLRIPQMETSFTDEAFDLAMHLIATHHGSGRPHFAEPWDDEFTTPICERTHEAVIQRFGRLQRRYGRWGLAYLESLLRAADIAASRSIGIDPELDTDDLEGGEQ